MSSIDTQPAQAQAEMATDDNLGRVVARLAAVVGGERFPNADRAALKRWAPGQPPPLAFYRVWLRPVGDELPAPAQAHAWMLVTWGLALGISHQPGRPLGRVLAESRYAEARLERLLAAPPDVLPELVASLLRFLAAKGEPVDWLDAARLLLTQDADKREAVHRRIASDYFRHLPRTDKE